MRLLPDSGKYGIVYETNVIVSLIVSCVILTTLIPTLKKSATILLETSSRVKMNLKSFKDENKEVLSKIEEISKIEDIKIWDLTSSKTYTAVKILMKENKDNSVIFELKDELRRKYNFEEVYFDLNEEKSVSCKDNR